LQARAESGKTPQNLPHKQVLTEGCPCSLKDLTEEEQKAFGEVIESLAGPTEKEFNRKFGELVVTAAGAANAGKDEDAQQAAMKMLLMAGAKALKNPGPDTELGNTISACEGSGDWAGAEKARRKLLALRKQEGCAGMITKAQFDLSRLLRLLGRLDESWRYARAACKSASEADLAPLTVMTLENEAQCALERKDAGRALAAAEEAITLVKPERMQNLIRLRTLTLRAHCLLETGDEAGAERDLKAASKLESDLVFAGMGGAINAQARRREIQAELQVRRKNLPGAVKNLKRAVALWRKGADGCCGPSSYALVARARGLERLAAISKRLGNMTEAREALRKARSLRDEAKVPMKSKGGHQTQEPRRESP
jgi:tetratricopeptide (TPR) repeat protein